MLLQLLGDEALDVLALDRGDLKGQLVSRHVVGEEPYRFEVALDSLGRLVRGLQGQSKGGRQAGDGGHGAPHDPVEEQES